MKYCNKHYKMWKKNAGPNLQKAIYTTIQEKNYTVNIGLLKHAFRATAFRRLKKMLHVSTLSFRAGIAADRLLGPYFLPPRPSGAVYHDFLRNVLPELL
jgi:hypothetical protein